MATTRVTSITALEENSFELYKESVVVLIKIASNILNDPKNPKYRSISLGSTTVINKLLPASGAMECLFEMGFKEGDDKLVLPPESSLESLKYIHEELCKSLKQINSKSGSVEKPKRRKIDNKISLITKDLIALSETVNDSFLKQLISWCFYVLNYEDYELQLKALKLVPVVELNLNVMQKIKKLQMEFKKQQVKEYIDYQELLLIELCNWFNTEFFVWVNTPQCTNCNFIETVHVGISSKVVAGADRVEEYKCAKCNETVYFPRYKDPNILLETRKGRCGEWANCFCLLAKAMGWDVRLVFDKTDHVWVEVYSFVKSRWLHCDPCENVIDTPLMYECGWKKKLSYIIAYSIDEVQDVTWRYSCKHAEVRKNRKSCSEQELLNFIIKTRNILLSHVSPARKNYIMKRTALELADFLTQNSVKKKEEEMGRISGSLAWRLLRGETSNDEDFKPYVWKLDQEDEKKKKFVLQYITSKDEYRKNSRIIKNWRNGVFSLKSIFRKEEKDWKMTYLARTENSNRGILSWKFDTGEKFAIGTIELKLVRKTFETGIVSCKLCADESCVLIPGDLEQFSTDEFMGSRTVELVVELFSGSGDNSWQHAQILRQSLDSEDITFRMVLNLVEV